jgi:DNA-binding NarL/FixJ family response regulator
MYTEGEAAREMMDAGAAAYVPKVGSTDRLLQAIRGSSGSSDGS